VAARRPPPLRVHGYGSSGAGQAQYWNAPARELSLMRDGGMRAADKGPMLGLYFLAILHCLLSPLAVVVGMAFIGFVWAIPEFVRTGSAYSISIANSLYSGFLLWSTLFPAPLARMSCFGYWVVLLLNPFLLASCAAGIGLWLRETWGRRMAIWIACGSIFTIVNSPDGPRFSSARPWDSFRFLGTGSSCGT
jgi:hypothetical protein